VLDHRYNTRTVHMNPVFRFLYLNMNYHVEHHMYPSVPYHALPALHREIKDQLAPPLPTTWAAYREIFRTLTRQQRDVAYEIPLDVPDVSGTRRRVDAGASNWMRSSDGAIDLGAVDSLAVGELRRVDVGERTFVLARLADTEFALCDGVCTHAAVHLADGAVVDGLIECPKHNARFDARTGEAVRKPAREPLSIYEVEQIGGRVMTRFTKGSAKGSTKGTR
jgi:nitrite reductase/ring-hydroxylating ferredoxin subunit